MTDAEKKRVRNLRDEGLGYRAIAVRLDLPLDTVKSFCRRNGLSGAAKTAATTCRHCGTLLPARPVRKERKFCSEACRRAWWSAHPELGNKAAFYTLTCAHCKEVFQSYGNQTRKYCSHACYISARFGEESGHDEGAV